MEHREVLWLVEFFLLKDGCHDCLDVDVDVCCVFVYLCLMLFVIV